MNKDRLYIKPTMVKSIRDFQIKFSKRYFAEGDVVDVRGCNPIWLERNNAGASDCDLIIRSIESGCPYMDSGYTYLPYAVNPLDYMRELKRVASVDNALEELKDHYNLMSSEYTQHLGHSWQDLLSRRPAQTQQLPTPKKEETKMETTQSQTTMKLDLGMSLESLISAQTEQLIKANVEEYIQQPLGQIVKKEVASLKPTFIKIPERKDIKIEGKLHKKFKDVLFLAQIEKQCMIVGEAGSGKTHLCSQIAKSLDTEFRSISCSGGMSEAHILGRMLFDGTYVPSDFITVYENGGVFLFDEIDAADSNTLLVINSALANGYVSVPNRKDNPIARRNDNCVIIVSGNSWGSGSSNYHGRNYLDAAFLDRFSASKVDVTYDESLEKDLAGEEHTDMLHKFWGFRKNVKKYDLNRVVSTRTIISAVRQKLSGATEGEIFNRFFLGWTPEEVAKAKKA